MKSKPSTYSLKTKNLTLQEATNLLNAECPPDQITQRDLLRCAALENFRIFFEYDGMIFLKTFDPISEQVFNDGAYSYSGNLAILDYRYGMERGSEYFEVINVQPQNIPDFAPDNSLTTLDLPNQEQYYFSPFLNCAPDEEERVHIGADVKLNELTIDPCDLPKIMESVTQLKRILREKQKNEGRYTLEDAASIIAANSTEHIEDIEYLLFKSIKGGILNAYHASSRIPITDPHKFNSIGMVLLYEIYQDHLSKWLKENIPHLEFEFQNRCIPTKPMPVTGKTNPRKIHKLNRDSLDVPIDKAILLAGNMEFADVYLQLKELALDGEKPFTGSVAKSALCYTNDDNENDKFTKNALAKRLKNRREALLTAT